MKAPRVDAHLSSTKQSESIFNRSVFWLVVIWTLVTGFMVLIMKWLAFDYLRPATVDLLQNKYILSPPIAITRVVLHWLPPILFTLFIAQFSYSFWQSFFSLVIGDYTVTCWTGMLVLNILFFIGFGNGLASYHTWGSIDYKTLKRALRRYAGNVASFNIPMQKDQLSWDNIGHCLDIKDLKDQKIAGALIWNQILEDLFMRDMIVSDLVFAF